MSDGSAGVARPIPATDALAKLDMVRTLEKAEPSVTDDARDILDCRPVHGRYEAVGVSLLFAPGSRPCRAQVTDLAAHLASFQISFDPAEAAGPQLATTAKRWLEVLAHGLTFDLQGLAPGSPQVLRPHTHRYGLTPEFEENALEVVCLHPASTSPTYGQMLPVIRSLAWTAAALANLPGARAIGWHAARTLSSTDHFRGSVLRWLEGGPFPGLGLTALVPTLEGGLQSEGLALFTGQEIRLAPVLAHDRRAGARLSLRLLHWLVEYGRLTAATMLPGPSGDPLQLRPTAHNRIIEISPG